MIMVFNATFNNISAISWRSVLLMNETGIPGENHRLMNYYYTTIVCVMMVCLLDSQLHVQSVPITTIFVSSNPGHGEVYLMLNYVIRFVSDLRQVGGFLRVLWFPLKINLNAMI